MLLPRPFGARPCRFCGQPLGALDRLQGDSCRRLECRRRATLERRRAERAAEIARRQRLHARALDMPALAAAPVLWLTPYRARMVPMAAATRREQQAWLDALAALPPPAAAPPPRGPEPAAEPRIGGHACAFCGGRCCAIGAHHHAFVDRTLLQRHAQRATGGDTAAAARDYARHIPAEHAFGGCVYQGRTGCALPREMRSDVCNGYRCDELAETSRQAGRAEGVVVAMASEGGVARAAWARDEGLEPLPRRTTPGTVTPRRRARATRR